MHVISSAENHVTLSHTSNRRGLRQPTESVSWSLATDLKTSFPYIQLSGDFSIINTFLYTEGNNIVLLRAKKFVLVTGNTVEVIQTPQPGDLSLSAVADLGGGSLGSMEPLFVPLVNNHLSSSPVS